MPHILVIEDDAQFRQMLVQMLQKDGHEVKIAADGIAALKMLQTLKPDLIITDILMPRMDGVDTILELERRGSKIPIIAMSGGRRAVTAEFNLDSASLLGVAATLAKPFVRADLRKAIERALPTHKAVAGAAP
jgi:CheY-like chemotaxis protein